MSDIRDLPRLVGEFWQMARAYLRQETLEPARKLGHFAGFSIGAAFAWLFALILLAVAGMRTIIELLPEGPYWEALGYLITVIILIAFVALLFALGPKQPEPTPINIEDTKT